MGVHWLCEGPEKQADPDNVVRLDEAKKSGKPSKKDPRKLAAEEAWRQDGFKRFWELYPRKTAKNEARKAWMGLFPGADKDKMLERYTLVARLLAVHKREWLERDRRLIPYPATWLRRESFDAEDVAEAEEEGER